MFQVFSVLGVHSVPVPVLIAHWHCGSSVHKLCTRCTPSRVLIKKSWFQINWPCTLSAHSCTMPVCQCTRVHNTSIIYDSDGQWAYLHALACVHSKRNMSCCITLNLILLVTPHFVFSLGAGLRSSWYNKNKTRLLLASRRHDRSWTRKYAGNTADGLRSSPWKRA